MQVPNEPKMQNYAFSSAACASVLMAFSISFASLWFLSTTTATSYSLQAGRQPEHDPCGHDRLVALKVPWNIENMASIMVGPAREYAQMLAAVQVIMGPCNRQAKEKVVPGSRSTPATVCSMKEGGLC